MAALTLRTKIVVAGQTAALLAAFLAEMHTVNLVLHDRLERGLNVSNRRWDLVEDCVR